MMLRLLIARDHDSFDISLWYAADAWRWCEPYLPGFDDSLHYYCFHISIIILFCSAYYHSLVNLITLLLSPN
jgi:hypothetical protein